MDEIKELLQHNNVQKVFEKVSKDKPMSYQYGPLNKSKETQIFEEVIHDIIKDYEDGTKNITFLKQNGQIFLERKGESINLKNLLDNVNFNHLSIAKEDIKKYAANKRLYVAPLRYKEFQYQIKEADAQQAVSLSALDYGEMLAINKYTGPYYKTMSLLLRDTDSMQTNQVASTMLHIAMASHGLNKLPDIDLPQVIRSQDEYNLNQLIKNAEEHKVTQEKGFISTSLSSNVKIDTDSNNKNVRIIYKNVRGKSISVISQRPDELEYLLPPSTQIRWTGYKNTSTGYVFTAEGANVVIDEPSLPAFKASEEIIKAAENLEKKVNSPIPYIDYPAATKTKTTSDQPTKIVSEALAHMHDIKPVFPGNKPPVLPKAIKAPLPEQVMIPRINEKDETTKPKIQQKPVPDTNNNLKLTTEDSDKVKVSLEQFGQEIIDISLEQNVITEQHKEKYLEINPANQGSKFFNDVKEVNKEQVQFKDKIYNLAKRISKSLGSVSLFFYLDEKINTKNDFKAQIQTDLKNKQNNKKTEPLEKEDISQIVKKLEELLDDKAINDLKQSRKHKEFKEAVTDMVNTVNRDPNITMSTYPKLNTTVILKAQLDSLDKLCDKTLRKHNTPIFHNIGNVIKHGIKAVINLNNKEVYEEEVKAMRYYIDATQYARKNTLSVVNEIKNILKDKDELSRKHASPQDRKSEDRRVAANIAKQARVKKRFISR